MLETKASCVLFLPVTITEGSINTGKTRSESEMKLCGTEKEIIVPSRTGDNVKLISSVYAPAESTAKSFSSSNTHSPKLSLKRTEPSSACRISQSDSTKKLYVSGASAHFMMIYSFRQSLFVAYTKSAFLNRFG